MKILAIGAHPDDIEIYMFGFLSICAARGDDIILCIATDGAQGNVGDEKNLVDVRARETLKALSYFDFKPIMLNIPDGNIEFYSNTFTLLKSTIDNYNPDLIVTHSQNDYHADHRALSKFVVNIAGFKCPVLFADNLMGVDFKPLFYIDITKYFLEKKKAILSHKSQRPEKFFKATELLNRFRSAQCNTPDGNYVECYNYFPRFPFSDIRSLLPPEPQQHHYYSKDSRGLM